MRFRQLLLGICLAMPAALPLVAQVPVLSSIQGPYPAVQTSQPIHIAGGTYSSGAVSYGPHGTPLVLSGSDFGPSGTVLFPGAAKGSTVAATVTNWSPTILFVSVPSSATTGLVSIVTNEAKTSNALPFIVTKGTYAGSCPASPPSSQLEITTSSLPTGTVSTSYSASLNASGGTPPYTWSLSAGTLPAGLSLSSSGAIAGTPTAGVSADNITVRAQDSRSQVTDAVLSLSVFISQQTVYSYSVPASGGYDRVGNIKQFTDSVMGTWSFGYDDLNRLTSGAASSGPYNGENLCMAYDSFGNRTEYSIQTGACPSNPTLITYPSTNRVPLGGYSYDASGNVLSDGTNSYAYDGDGRLCAVQTNSLTGGTIAIAYLYDADGRRVAKGNITPNSSQPCNMATNGFQVSESYVLGQSGEQLTTLSSSGWQRTNVYGAGKLLATYDTEGPYDGVGLHFQLTDPLGTRRLQVSDQGVPETYCQSLPYGDRLSCIAAQNAPASGDDATPLHFTGKPRDTESGLDYLGARYYASSMGRFMSPDWAASASPVPYAAFIDPQSLDLYSYMRNNPLSGIDADGHCPTGWLRGLCNFGESLWKLATGQDARDPQNSAGQNTVPMTELVTHRILTPTTIKYSFATLQGVTLLSGLADGGLSLAALPEEAAVEGGLLAAEEAAATGTRYVGDAEAQVIADTGMVPNTNAAGASKQVFYTPEDPMVGSSASEIQDAYQLPSTPTHIVTLDTFGITNSYGGNVEGGAGIEMITNQPIPATSITPINPQ